MKRSTLLLGAGLTTIALFTTPVATAGQAATSKPVTGLEGPRGMDIGESGKTVVAEEDGTISRAFRYGKRAGETRRLGKVPADFIAPAVAVSPDDTVWALTAGGPPGTGAASLYIVKRGHDPELVADIGAYFADHPDPYNLEGEDVESNPFGLAATRHSNAVLVADAANNAVLRVDRDGKIRTVARVKPREVPMPEGFESPPGEDPMPPAGTPIPTEAVTTSVTQGPDGSVYIGELVGWPGTAGYANVWRVKPGARNAVCDPATPMKGDCRLYADELTSIVDLATGENGSIYVLELSKQGWFAMEMGKPGAEVGALIRIGHDRERVRRELGAGTIIMPGSVDVDRRGRPWVTAPFSSMAGPGKLFRVR